MFDFIRKIRAFSILSSASMWVFTSRKGEKVGVDELGNTYYRTKGGDGTRWGEKRWVMYAGEPEASLVPPEWHAWLHRQSDDVPGEVNPRRQSWQKPHQPNMTGSAAAYLPPGHAYKGGQRDAATGDYEAWTP